MSNVNKPTIPVEVADAIEELRVRADSESILYSVLNDPTAGISVDALRTIPFDTLLAALVNGYGRELTEEQKRAESERELARTYENHRGGIGLYNTAEEDDAFADGIEHALDVIGVKIDGVNA